MNGKKSRQFRRIAEQLTIGKKAIKYIIGKSPVFERLKYLHGELQGQYTGTIIKADKGVPTKLSIQCTRFKYKQLKKAYMVKQWTYY